MNTEALRFKATIKLDYPLIIKRNAIEELGAHVSGLIVSDRPLVLVSDDGVPQQHIDTAIRSLGDGGWSDIVVIKFPSGECHKSNETHQQLINKLFEHRTHRRSVLLALGGGVVCDTVGFVASSYMRGLDYVNVPTTLISQLDAAIGGKVAVNHTHCKNLIGAFWHPRGVIIDPNLLQTLPDEDFRSGLAEAVKVAVIHSASLFDCLEQHAAKIRRHGSSSDVIDSVIIESVRAKIELLQPDPFENNLQRKLNFGHTFAHPIEAMSDFTLRHGYAVSIGMCIAAHVAEQRGLISSEDSDRLISLLRTLGLPVSTPSYDTDALWRHLLDIRAIRANHFYFVIPTRISEVSIIDDLSREEFLQAYRALCSGS